MREAGGNRLLTRAARNRARRGSALLAVLWLSAALAAIAFSLAITVRGETERESTAVDGLRSYYLAVGGVERATIELLWSINQTDKRPIPKGARVMDYTFPSGDVHVEFLPEAGKLDVNKATPEQLFKLMTALGIDPGRASEITSAIDAARRPDSGGDGPAAGFSQAAPSFQRVPASFQEIEELLAVRGVTPDIFYGTYIPLAEGETAPGGQRLAPRMGLVDCLSVYGAADRVDVNTAAPAVLAALGLPPAAVAALVEHRNAVPFTIESLAGFLESIGASAGGSGLRVEGTSIATLRATARLRLADGKLSDLRRTVAAQVKYMPEGFDSPIHILRWYDSAWSN